MESPTRITPTPESLHRKRLLLIAGVVTVLPAAAFAPGLLAPDHQSKTPLLAAVDEMAVVTAANARVNETAVAGVEVDESSSDATRQTMPPAPPVMLAALPASTVVETRVNATIDADSGSVSDPEVRWFNGRPVRPVRKLAMLVTAYSPDAASCGESADGITASGYSVWTNGMKLVAADTGVLPFGSLITVPGYDDDNIVPVLDRGGAIKGNRLDLLYPTHEQAEQWGAQRLEVTVWEYADGQPNDFEIRYNSASALR
jgi:3D (Asp-Asp-Asp) domain-containing protein